MQASPGADVSVVLPPNSLLVFRGGFYRRYLHGVDAAGVDVLDASVVNAGDAGDAAASSPSATGAAALARSGCGRVSFTLRVPERELAAFRLT